MFHDSVDGARGPHRRHTADATAPYVNGPNTFLQMGIDNLEHGFMPATDFVPDKQADVCPGQARGQQTVAALDVGGAPFAALVKKLVDKHVALTSTLTVFETFTRGRPLPPFTPIEAISIATLNGAKYLGRDARIGTIAAGKQADLVVVNGDPSRTIADVRKVETVFKQGIGYDPEKLIESVKGQVGVW